MARVKTGVVRRKRHNKVLEEAKGFSGASGTVFKQARQATTKAKAYSTRDRKQRKRKMRELWIIRINAGARMFGLSYSKFMNGLKNAGIELDRKVLAEMAAQSIGEFEKLVEVAKANLK